jgi:putative ABC transport system permease protein
MSDHPRNLPPPKLARWILQLMVPLKVREFLLGDLEEEFRKRVDSDGLRKARYWYWIQILHWIFPKKPKSNKAHPEKSKGDAWISTFLSDAKYGMRILLKRPGFFIAAVLTLAFGIGANTAIFSAVNSVLLRPLPFRDSDRIATIWENNVTNGIEQDDVPPANFLDWQERQQVFETMATLNPWGLDYTGGTEPETWLSALVSKDFFEILGVRPLYGRLFLPEEYQEGRNKVVVLSYGLWQRKFGGDRSIIGRVLSLDGEPTTIVGVMPPEFRLYFHNPEKEAFQPQPFTEDWKYQRRATYLKVIGRLKPGVSFEQAQSAMNTIAAQIAKENPRTNEGIRVNVVPIRKHFISKIRVALLVLSGAVGLVLLIGCANLANLQLARGSERHREIAVRLAIGASRLRVIQQLLIENLILASFGCALGIIVAHWSMKLIIMIAPDNIPRLETIRLDLVVLSFAAGLSFLNAIIFGLIPALHLSRFDLQHSLKDGSGTIMAPGQLRQNVRNILVVSQVAIAIVLLVGAGLFFRSMLNLLNVNPGFVKHGIVALQVFLYAHYETPEKRVIFIREGISRLKRVPGVKGVGVTTSLPFFESSLNPSIPITLEGDPLPAGQERTAFLTVTMDDYFPLLGIPLKQGRFFNQADHENGPQVTIINEEMARKLNIKESPIGKKIQFQLRQKTSSFEVIGVVGSLRHDGLDRTQRPEFFIPYGKSPSGHVIFVVRTLTDPNALIPSLKSQIWSVDSTLPFYRVETMEQLISDSLTQRRFQLILLMLFAAVAVLLCAFGIYGLISFITSKRTNEIGIRIALGAQKIDIWKMIIQQGLRLTITGLIWGVIGAFLLTRYLASLLFEIKPLDPITYIGGCAFLLAVAVLACLLPARRAMRIDPLLALRYE